MKRVSLALMLALAAGLSAAPVRAQDEPGFTVHGEVRTRWEYLENYSDLSDATDDNYDIFPYRVRIGARGVFARNVIGYAELQNVGVFGHRSPQEVPQYPVDQVEQNEIDITEVHLYQGFLEMSKIGDTAFGLRIGRQEHAFGNQLILGDLDFYGGQSFDGVRAWFDWERFDINMIYYRIDENNDGCVTGCGDDNLDAYGAYLTWGIGAWGDIEPYVIRFADGLDGNDNFYVIGARWTRIVNDEVNSDKLLDWSFEYAMQSGDTGAGGATDIGGDILEGWIGINLGAERNHRVHVGALMASGDDAGTATEDEAWRPVGYDTWDHNRLGDADWVNLGSVDGVAITNGVEDIFAGYTFTGENHGFRASYHIFTLAEDIGGEDDLGTEVDVAYHYTFNPNLGIDAGVAMVEPGDVFVGLDDSAMRVWGQARLRF